MAAGLRLALSAMAATALTTLSAAQPQPLSAPAAFNPADPARGKALSEICVTCHGVEGQTAGDPPFRVPMLAGQRPEVIFQSLRDYKSGRRVSDVMAPNVAELSEQDMRDLAAYLSAGGPQLPGSHDQGSWAHEKVRRDCTACHGESGMGVMPGVPVLTGQHADYLEYSLRTYRDGRRKDATMAKVAAKLSDQDIRRLAVYFSRQEHLRLAK
jgi:cytochrome c553